MITQNLFNHFLQKHHLEAIRLPNKTKYWHLSSAQITDLKLTMDEQFTRTVYPDFPREVHVWEEGPVLYEGLFGPGIAFRNLEEANPFLSKIRPFGFSEEEWHAHFALSNEDVSRIYSELNYSVFYLDPSQPVTEETQTIIALEKPYGYLIQGSNLWFAKEDHLRKFESFIEEMVRML